MDRICVILTLLLLPVAGYCVVLTFNCFYAKTIEIKRKYVRDRIIELFSRRRTADFLKFKSEHLDLYKSIKASGENYMLVTLGCGMTSKAEAYLSEHGIVCRGELAGAPAFIFDDDFVEWVKKQKE